jgi:hypothetical protein
MVGSGVQGDQGVEMTVDRCLENLLCVGRERMGPKIFRACAPN